MRPHKYCGCVSTLVLSLTVPVSAHAEPSASMSHLPFLWILAAGIAAGLTWIVVRTVGRSGRLQTPFRKWVLVILLLIVLLVFIAPVFVGLGSMLITGRTM